MFCLIKYELNVNQMSENTVLLSGVKYSHVCLKWKHFYIRKIDSLNLEMYFSIYFVNFNLAQEFSYLHSVELFI